MLDITSAGAIIGAITVGMTFLSTLVRHLVLDKEKVKEHKEQIRYHQEQMKQAQKNKDMKGVQKHQESMMSVMSDQMRHNMKPMIFTMIPFLIVFSWMGAQYNDIGNIHNVLVVDPIPEGAEVADVSSIPQLNHSIRDGSVVWVFGNLTYPWEWERFGWYGDGIVRVNLTFKNAPSAVRSELTADYVSYYVNGSIQEFSSARTDDPNADLTVKKENIRVEGSVVSYDLAYENRNPYYVTTVFGVGLGWLRWYILCSFVSSMILNKIFGIT
ncbi:MAG: EMC3/TMCO1 family protein [Candidatus Altiarchaeota archaeon]